MKAIVHVHQQRIRRGEPAIIVRTYRGSTHHSEVLLDGPARIVHSDVPDRCGARVWIETDTKYLTYVDAPAGYADSAAPDDVAPTTKEN